MSNLIVSLNSGTPERPKREERDLGSTVAVGTISMLFSIPTEQISELSKTNNLIPEVKPAGAEQTPTDFYSIDQIILILKALKKEDIEGGNDNWLTNLDLDRPKIRIQSSPTTEIILMKSEENQ